MTDQHPILYFARFSRSTAASLFVASLYLLMISNACSTSVSKQDRVSARVHYDLGVAAMQQSNLSEAVREFTLAARFNPKFAEVYNALGLTYHAKNESQKSLHNYQKAIALKPDFSEAYNNYGALLMDLQRYEEAAQCFKKVLDDIMYPTPSYAEGNLGWALYNSGKTSTAIHHLKNAIATNPKFCRGYLWLGKLYRKQHNIKQAILYLNKFSSICIKDAKMRKFVDRTFIEQAHYELAKAYLEAGNVKKAHAHLRACKHVGTLSGLGEKCQELLMSSK